MKKALTKVLLIVMTIVTIATVMPISANASTSNAKKIYNILTEDLGFNSAAACGILANIERESDFNPKLVIRDSNGLTSGGLCQWNGGRFKNLKNYCYDKGYDYLSIEGQLNYLNYELQKSSYKHIYSYLKNVKNTADGAYNAGHYWCYYFEIPSNRSVKAKQRGSMAKNDYWPVYGETTPKTPKLTLVDGTNKYDIASDISLKWTSGGGACTGYKVFIKKKDPVTKTYLNKDIITASTTKTSYDIPAFSLEVGGYYAIRVRAYNKASGKYVNSPYVYCRVNCYEHDFTSEILKEPTFKKTGLEKLTCEKCGLIEKETLPVLTPQDFTETKTSKPEVTSASPTAIRIKWKPTDHATGYRVYIRENNSWKLLKKISADDELTYLYKNLTAATEYKFCVRAYLVYNGKTYMNTASSTLLTSTETHAPSILELDDKYDKCTVSWDKVKGADGYQIYYAEGKDSYKRVATVSNKCTEYTIRGLEEGQSYRFVVRSYIKLSNGSFVYSNCSSAKTLIID